MCIYRKLHQQSGSISLCVSLSSRVSMCACVRACMRACVCMGARPINGPHFASHQCSNISISNAGTDKSFWGNDDRRKTIVASPSSLVRACARACERACVRACVQVHQLFFLFALVSSVGNVTFVPLQDQFFLKLHHEEFLKVQQQINECP